MTVFNDVVARRLIFKVAGLSNAFKHYQSSDDKYGRKAVERVYFLHILPYPHRKKDYDKEYLEEYPEPMPVSDDIERLVNKYGWKLFIYGIKLFLRRRLKLQAAIGKKRGLLPEILDKVDKLRNVM